MGDEEREGRGFTIIDRRGGRDEDPGPAAEEEPERTPQAEASAPPPPETGRELPAIDFATFVLSLGTSALYHMGLIDDPETGGKAEPNLPLARQTIDTLAMLESKTRGNLEEQEAHLMESLLYELRMRYVEAEK